MKRILVVGAMSAIVAGMLPAAASAAVSRAPANLDFGTQTVGTASASQPVAITVTCFVSAPPFGCVIPDQFTSAPAFSGTNPGDFSQTTTCSIFGSGGNCSYSVTFNPTGPGPRSATLALGTGLGGSPGTVALSGTGASPPAPVIVPVPAATTKGKKCKKAKKGAVAAKKKCRKKKK